MPWQRQVADVALELLPNGLPAYRDVIVTVPRQQGKTTLVLAVELHRALMWPRPPKRQRILYSAQTGKDGRQKLLDDQVPILQASPLAALLDSRRANGGIRRESGGEGIDFKGGSRIDVMASSQESGHGKTIQLAVIDEAFADVDSHREQAMIPAMFTVQDAQQWTTSTAGWEASTFLKQKVDAGRAAVADDLDHGICFFEWSALPDEPIDDPQTWRGCMPALGYTITEEIIFTTLRTWKETAEEFERSVLNRWTTGEARVIPKEIWDAVNGDHEVERQGCSFGIDVDPNRAHASIAAANGPNGELVDNREGTGWLVGRLAELTGKYGGTVAVDSKGAASSLIPEMLDAGIPLERYTSDMVANATGNFYDAVADGKPKIRRDGRLETAVAGAKKRVATERWYWGRSNANVDITPLVALTLAYDLAASKMRNAEVWAVWA